MWHVVKDQLLPILVADFSRWRFKVRGKTPMKALMIWSESFFFGLEWSHRFCLELFPFRNLLNIKIITFLYIANVWRWNDFDVLRTCTRKTCWAKTCKCLRWLAFAVPATRCWKPQEICGLSPARGCCGRDLLVSGNSWSKVAECLGFANGWL